MDDRARWNEKYGNRNLTGFKHGPSQWLHNHEDLLAQLPKGKALDIASGFGRNSFYLEKMGFQVDAVDVSDIAIDWLKAEAIEHKLKIYPYRLDLAHDPFPQHDYTVIICFNFLFRQLFDAIKSHLSPGGLLIYETVFEDEAKQLGSKMNPAYMLERNELLHVFHDFRIIAYQEKIVEVPHGRHKALASLVAEKR